MDLPEAAHAAIDTFAAQPDVDDDAVVATLVEHGIEEAFAVRLVQFVPIACCRFALASTGVRFATTYRIMGSKGRFLAEFPLDSEPVYVAAEAFLAGATQEQALTAARVAARSAAFAAIRELVESGSSLQNIVTSPPIIFADEPTEAKPKKWWRFGR